MPVQINRANEKRAVSKDNSNSGSNSGSDSITPLIKHMTTNELCNNVYAYCRQGVEWVYTQVSDIVEARKLVAEKRAQTTAIQQDKKLN